MYLQYSNSWLPEAPVSIWFLNDVQNESAVWSISIILTLDINICEIRLILVVIWLNVLHSKQYYCAKNSKNWLRNCIIIHHFSIDIIYCQKDETDGKFKTFCTQFLHRLSFEHLRTKLPGQLFLVLTLPSANRQNNLDFLSKSITEIIDLYKLKGNYK